MDAFFLCFGAIKCIEYRILLITSELVNEVA